MKNKITDLRDHMFAQLERLSDEDLTGEDLTKEISRSKAISDIGKVIVESAKTELLYAKITGNIQERPTKFLEEEEAPVKKLERPAAEYSNKKHTS
jgi:hypothetical protein